MVEYFFLTSSNVYMLGFPPASDDSDENLSGFSSLAPLSTRPPAGPRMLCASQDGRTQLLRENNVLPLDFIKLLRKTRRAGSAGHAPAPVRATRCMSVRFRGAGRCGETPGSGRTTKLGD